MTCHIVISRRKFGRGRWSLYNKTDLPSQFLNSSRRSLHLILIFKLKNGYLVIKPFEYYRCSKWSLDSTISKRSLSRFLWFNTKYSCRSCHVWYPGGRPIGQPCGRRRRRLFGSSWRAESLEPSCHHSMASTSSAGSTTATTSPGTFSTQQWWAYGSGIKSP